MDRVIQLLKQYRYGVLVLLIGLGLMLLPSGVQNQEENDIVPEIQEADIQRQLEQILSQIDGAGEVRVMLTEVEGATTVYQQNANVSGDSNRQDTVVITDPDRAEQGLVCQVIPARYRGAIVVCQGGDRAAVRLAIVEAVSGVTGLTSDKISVLKMK